MTTIQIENVTGKARKQVGYSVHAWSLVGQNYMITEMCCSPSIMKAVRWYFHLKKLGYKQVGFSIGKF